MRKNYIPGGGQKQTNETRLQVEISWQTKDQEWHMTKVNALVDSGTEHWTMSWDCVFRIQCPIRKRERTLIIHQADGSAMPNSGTYTTRGLDIRIGSHLDRAVHCEIGQFAEEDLVIPHEWLKTHQPHIDWGQNKATFNSKFCKENGCTVTIEKEITSSEQAYALRLIHLLTEIQRSRLTIQPSTMNENCEWSIPEEFNEFQDIFSKTGADQLPAHSKWDHEIPILDNKQPP